MVRSDDQANNSKTSDMFSTLFLSVVIGLLISPVYIFIVAPLLGPPNNPPEIKIVESTFRVASTPGGSTLTDTDTPIDLWVYDSGTWRQWSLGWGADVTAYASEDVEYPILVTSKYIKDPQSSRFVYDLFWWPNICAYSNDDTCSTRRSYELILPVKGP